MFIQEKRVRKKQGNFWIFPRFDMVASGEWEILFTYDRGPLTFKRSTNIPFSSEKEAREVFDRIFTQVFLRKDHASKRKPLKTKTKKRHLFLVKDEL